MPTNAHASEENSSQTGGCRGGGRINRVVQSLNGWTLIFIGAITIAVTERIMEDFVSVSETAEPFVVGLVALCLLYGQLALAYYGRRLVR